MDSNHLTTRTYTALTCKLIVLRKEDQGLGTNQQQHDIPVDFTLHLDDPDRGEIDRITLSGKFHQLDRLQQVVNKYTTELIAKFPLPNMNNTTSDQTRSTTVDRHQNISTPESEPENSIGSKLYPTDDSQSTKSGLMNNLPGLRHSSMPSTTANDPNSQRNTAGSGISKLFGGWNKQGNDKRSRSKTQHIPLGAAAAVKTGFGESGTTKSANEQPATTPSLTGSESLDHQLHLGDLANQTAGEVVTLSPIQLFDLSNVLDDYAAEDAPAITKQPRSTTFSRANIPGNHDRFTDVDPTTASLSRLPNLPKMAAGGSQTTQVYNRTRRSRSSSNFTFTSVIPWAAAAAVAVGAPLLLFDSKPNPLKDAASKVKMPDIEGVKKTVTAAMSPTIVDPEPATTAANPNLPKPWQEQPVEAPVSNSPTNTQPIKTATQPPQSIAKIGTAPLPAALVGKSGTDLPTTAKIPGDNKLGILSVLPRNGLQSGIAPNPLSTPRLPAEANSIGSPADLRPNNLPSTMTAKPGLSTPKSAAAPINPGKLGASIVPGTVSVSTQPILLPSDLPGIGINPSGSSQMPLNPTRIDATGTKSPTKTIKQKVKPTITAKIAKPKAVNPTNTNPVRQPLFEQSAPIPANPNFINPEQLQPTEVPDFQNLPVVPTQPFPTANTDGGDWQGAATDSPSLQQTKRYFQSKWKANNTQSSPLQYVVQVNGKSGTVRSILPQGEAATTYLKQTKLIKAGQKLVSPAAAGSTDQKIRVVLQTDGNVDTFIEP
jgi:hypothetical protein